MAIDESKLSEEELKELDGLHCIKKKLWRPDNWEELKGIEEMVAQYRHESLHTLFNTAMERAADIILEAQEKLGFQMPTLKE